MAGTAPDTLLIIDDHALSRADVAAMLAMAFAGAVVLAHASLDEALASVAVAPAVVLLDIQLPGGSGLEGIEVILQRWPGARIVIVSAHDRSGTVRAASFSMAAWPWPSRLRHSRRPGFGGAKRNNSAVTPGHRPDGDACRHRRGRRGRSSSPSTRPA